MGKLGWFLSKPQHPHLVKVSPRGLQCLWKIAEDDRKKKEQKNTFTLQCCLRPALPLPSGFIDLSGRTSLFDHFTFLCPPKLSKFSKTIRLHISLLRIIFFRRSNSSFRFNKYFQRSGYAAGKLTRSPFDRPWSIPPLWASSTSLC